MAESVQGAEAARALLGALQHGEGFDSQRYAFFDAVGGDATTATLEGELGGLDDVEEDDEDEIGGRGGVRGQEEVEITMDDDNDGDDGDGAGNQDLSLAGMFVGLMKSKEENMQHQQQQQQQQQQQRQQPLMANLPMPALLHKMPIQQPAYDRLTGGTSVGRGETQPPPVMPPSMAPTMPPSQTMPPPPMPSMPPMPPPPMMQPPPQQQHLSHLMAPPVPPPPQHFQQYPPQPQSVPPPLPPHPYHAQGSLTVEQIERMMHGAVPPMQQQPPMMMTMIQEQPPPPPLLPEQQQQQQQQQQQRQQQQQQGQPRRQQQPPSLREVQQEQLMLQQKERKEEQEEYMRRQRSEQQNQSIDGGRGRHSSPQTQQYSNRNSGGHVTNNRDSRGVQRSRYPSQGSGQGNRSRTRASAWMSADEIDRITRIQYMTTHTDNPYRDDYCYQATRFKEEEKGGRRRAANGGGGAGVTASRHFAPTEVRELLPTEKGSNRDPVQFLQVEGLGIVARPNTKAPKPLLDVKLGAGAGDAMSDDDDDHDDDDERRPLADEPMLAARCLIEDGECLLLDIDDVDRIIFHGADEEGGIDPLRHRRSMLVDAVATSLHLSVRDGGSQLPNVKTMSKRKSVRDGVFLRVNLLAKGTRLFSRLLTRLEKNENSELVAVILHTILRNVAHVFSATESHKVEANHEIGDAAAAAIRSIASNSVIEDLVQAEGDFGDALLAEEELPLFIETKKKVHATGLSTIVLALMDRARAIGSAPCMEFVDLAGRAIALTVDRVKASNSVDADAAAHLGALEAQASAAVG